MQFQNLPDGGNGCSLDRESNQDLWGKKPSGWMHAVQMFTCVSPMRDCFFCSWATILRVCVCVCLAWGDGWKPIKSWWLNWWRNFWKSYRRVRCGFSFKTSWFRIQVIAKNIATSATEGNTSLSDKYMLIWPIFFKRINIYFLDIWFIDCMWYTPLKVAVVFLFCRRESQRSNRLWQSSSDLIMTLFRCLA